MNVSIRAFLVIGLSLVVSLSPLTTLAQADSESNSPGESELEAIAEYLSGRSACLDIYRLGSVHLSFAEDTISKNFTPGETITIHGSLKNTNSFALAGGRLLARVLRQDSSVAASNWHPVIAEMDVPGNFSLAAQGSRDFSFNWPVPSGASDGTYRVEFSYLAGGRFSISGLSFVPNFTGGSVLFSVANAKSPAYLNFDRGSVQLNGSPLALRAVPPILAPEKPVRISANLTLPKGIAGPVNITTALYNWSDSDQKPPVLETTSQETISPGGSLPIIFEWASATPGVYEAVFTAKSTNPSVVSSILKVRFPVAGDSPRIIFSGITSVKNGQATVTACALNATYSQASDASSTSTTPGQTGSDSSPTTTTSGQDQVGSLLLSVIGSDGKTIASAETSYQAGQLSTLTKEIPIDQLSSDIDLITTAKTASGTEADSSIIRYALQDLLQPVTAVGAQTIISSPRALVSLAVVALILISLIFGGFAIARRLAQSKNIKPPTSPPSISNQNTTN